LGTYPSSQFSKPNFQELLTDLTIAVSINSSAEKAAITLAERVAIAVSYPEKIIRFGGLSLGESWAMVNGFRDYRDSDGEITWLEVDNRGLIALPVWIDRATTQGKFQRFSLSEGGQFTEQNWITINP
jgi:CRISPR-associated protein Cas5t